MASPAWCDACAKEVEKRATIAPENLPRLRRFLIHLADELVCRRWNLDHGTPGVLIDEQDGLADARAAMIEMRWLGVGGDRAWLTETFLRCATNARRWSIPNLCEDGERIPGAGRPISSCADQLSEPLAIRHRAPGDTFLEWRFAPLIRHALWKGQLPSRRIAALIYERALLLARVYPRRRITDAHRHKADRTKLLRPFGDIHFPSARAIQADGAEALEDYHDKLKDAERAVRIEIGDLKHKLSARASDPGSAQQAR